MLRSRSQTITCGAAGALLAAPALLLVLSSNPSRAQDPATAPATSPATTQATTAPASAGDTTAARRGTLRLQADLEGVLDAVDAYEVRFTFKAFGGDLEIAKAAPHDAAVKKGDVLLEVVPKPIDRQLAQARNDLRTAEANAAKAEADLKLGQQGDALARKAADTSLAHATKDLKWWDDRGEKETVRSANLMVRMNDFYVESQSDELAELKKMYKADDLSDATADLVMKRTTRILEIYQEMAGLTRGVVDRLTQLELAKMRDGQAMGVDMTRQSVEQVEAAQKQALVLRETAVESARIALEQAREKVTDLEADRAKFTVRSPVDGVVVYGAFANKAWQEKQPKELAVGEKVQPAQVLMTVYAPGQLRARVDLPESKRTWAKPGTPVRVTPAALPDKTYDGTCQRPATAGHAKGAEQAFDVTVTLPPVDERLAPGFKVTVALDHGRLDDVLLVPATAVHNNKVWVKTGDAKDDKPEPRRVTVGESDGERTQILAGLKEGEEVLTQAKK